MGKEKLFTVSGCLSAILMIFFFWGLVPSFAASISIYPKLKSEIDLYRFYEKLERADLLVLEGERRRRKRSPGYFLVKGMVNSKDTMETVVQFDPGLEIFGKDIIREGRYRNLKPTKKSYVKVRCYPEGGVIRTERANGEILSRTKVKNGIIRLLLIIYLPAVFSWSYVIYIAIAFVRLGNKRANRFKKAKT